MNDYLELSNLQDNSHNQNNNKDNIKKLDLSNQNLTNADLIKKLKNKNTHLSNVIEIDLSHNPNLTEAAKILATALHETEFKNPLLSIIINLTGTNVFVETEEWCNLAFFLFTAPVAIILRGSDSPNFATLMERAALRSWLFYGGELPLKLRGKDYINSFDDSLELSIQITQSFRLIDYKSREGDLVYFYNNINPARLEFYKRAHYYYLQLVGLKNNQDLNTDQKKLEHYKLMENFLQQSIVLGSSKYDEFDSKNSGMMLHLASLKNQALHLNNNLLARQNDRDEIFEQVNNVVKRLIEAYYGQLVILNSAIINIQDKTTLGIACATAGKIVVEVPLFGKAAATSKAIKDGVDNIGTNSMLIAQKTTQQTASYSSQWFDYNRYSTTEQVRWVRATFQSDARTIEIYLQAFATAFYHTYVDQLRLLYNIRLAQVADFIEYSFEVLHDFIYKGLLADVQTAEEFVERALFFLAYIQYKTEKQFTLNIGLEASGDQLLRNGCLAIQYQNNKQNKKNNHDNNSNNNNKNNDIADEDENLNVVFKFTGLATNNSEFHKTLHHQSSNIKPCQFYGNRLIFEWELNTVKVILLDNKNGEIAVDGNQVPVLKKWEKYVHLAITTTTNKEQIAFLKDHDINLNDNTLQIKKYNSNNMPILSSEDRVQEQLRQVHQENLALKDTVASQQTKIDQQQQQINQLQKQQAEFAQQMQQMQQMFQQMMQINQNNNQNNNLNNNNNTLFNKNLNLNPNDNLEKGLNQNTDNNNNNNNNNTQ